MKYNYLFVIILFFGCTLTNQQKGENGIKDYLNKKMNDPKSYELIEFGEIEDDYTILSKDKNFINYKIKYDTFNDGKQKFEEDIRFKVLNELSSRDQDKSIGARSFSEYVNNLVGPTLAKMFFTKYPEKVWGISTDKLTSEWAPKRIEIREKITPFYTGQYAAVGKYGTGSIAGKYARRQV